MKTMDFIHLVDDEDEGESSSSDVPSHYSYVSANSDTASQNQSASPVIDLRHYLAASTSDVDNLELMSTDMELWTTSSSSLSLSSASPSICTTTTEYSNPQFPSFRDLLHYSPSVVEQPQPTDDILVPMNSVMDPKLRNPPNVVITKLSMLEQLISFQDHSTPNIDQDVDTQTTTLLLTTLRFHPTQM